MTSQQDGGPNTDPISDGLRELVDELAQAIGGVTNALMLAPQIVDWFIRRQQHQIGQSAQSATWLATARRALREVLHPVEATALGLGPPAANPYAPPGPAAAAPVRVDLSRLAETLDDVCGVLGRDPVTVLRAAYGPGLAAIEVASYAAELHQRLLGLLTLEQRQAAERARARRRAQATGRAASRAGGGRTRRQGGGDAAGRAARRRAVAEDAIRTVLAGDPARAETVISSEGFGAVAHRLAQVCRTLGLTPVEAMGQAVFMFTQPRGLGDVRIDNAAAVVHARLGWLADPRGIPDWLAAHRVSSPAPAGTGRDGTIIDGEVVHAETIGGPARTAGRLSQDPDSDSRRVRATAYPGPVRPGARPPGGQARQALPAAAPVRRALPAATSRGR